jgi:hypothetical protein
MGFVVCRDLQTGGVVSIIGWKGPNHDKVGRDHITYLMNGRMVAVVPLHVVSSMYTYNVNHGKHRNPDLAVVARTKVGLTEDHLDLQLPSRQA